MSCPHDWKPVEEWSGRYRCALCKCLGYRQLVNGGARGNPVVIVPYICSVRKCGKWAVRVVRKKGKNYCTDHKDENP